MKLRIQSLILLVCVFSVPTLRGQEADDAIDFNRDVMPIFNQHCMECHGPDEQESGFRLDSRVAILKGGDYGEPGVVPGEVAKSMLISVVTYEDEDLAMPPDGKISEEEIAVLKRWVAEGAVWPGQMDAEVVREKSDHWSFQKVERPAVPKVESPFPVHNEIDLFLQSKLQDKSITPSEEADARTLIRRASIVLTGLPPTPEEVSQFQADHSRDANLAYTELVDRLLASPHFGERWAQHWLDVIRWAETNGSESNMYRKNAWLYRDYVTQAFNDDKPYDKFVVEQLAGDTIGMGEATGFLVAGPHVPAATVGREESAKRQARADRMDEVMQTVGASMMGMTIGCARCHNHKFDPISINDYYSMTAAFGDVEFGSRFPEYNEDHPRQRKAKEVWPQIEKQRDIIRTSGPWIEKSLGYDELHFYPKETTGIRIEFLWPNIRIDELEFFGKKQGDTNLIHKERVAAVRQNEEVELIKEFQVLNDGLYGTMGWQVKSGKGSKQRPWLEFDFDSPKSVDRMRISTNREDSMEIEYLVKLNPKNFGEYIVKVLDENGEWKQVAHSKNIANKDKEKPERAKAIAKIQGLLDVLAEDGPKPSFVARFIEPGKTHVLRRGSPENKGDEVSPAGLTELDGDLGVDADADGQQRRAAFAEWLIRKEHPMTSRVMVNRIWHHVFGQGIVTTTSDFGKAGAPPTHPELLDWLASEFVEPSDSEAWSMKNMIRKMVMSHAFRQQSLPREDCVVVDAGASLLWRYPPKRVEAEVIRDSILQASGKLDDSIGGKSYRIHNVKKRYAQWVVLDNHSEKTWRRLLYQERMRRVDDRNFTAFDFPDCGQIKARRPVSTTPLQALNLMNSEFIVQQAQLIAERAKSESGDAALKRCFELILNREPTEEETELCSAIADEESLAIVCRALLNSNEFAFLP